MCSGSSAESHSPMGARACWWHILTSCTRYALNSAGDVNPHASIAHAPLQLAWLARIEQHVPPASTCLRGAVFRWLACTIRRRPHRRRVCLCAACQPAHRRVRAHRIDRSPHAAAAAAEISGRQAEATRPRRPTSDAPMRTGEASVARRSRQQLCCTERSPLRSPVAPARLELSMPTWAQCAWAARPAPQHGRRWHRTANKNSNRPESAADPRAAPRRTHACTTHMSPRCAAATAHIKLHAQAAPNLASRPALGAAA
jgi:hypothetical protein